MAFGAQPHEHHRRCQTRGEAAKQDNKRIFAGEVTVARSVLRVSLQMPKLPTAKLGFAGYFSIRSSTEECTIIDSVGL